MKRLLSSLVVLGLAGCGGGTGPAEETIKLGVIASTTGELASVGTAELEAVNLAVDEINAAGGVLGKKLKVVHRDDGTDTGKAKAAAEALVAAEVPVVIGGVGSAFSLAAAEVLAPAKITQISPSSTSPLLTTFEDDNYLFRTCPSDAFQGKLIAQRSRAKGHQKAAVLFPNGAYGEGFANAFEQGFEAAGGTVFRHGYESGQTNFATLLGAVFENSPDAVVLVAYPVDGPTIVKEYNTGFLDRGAFWFFGDAIATQDFIDGVGANGFTFQHEGTVPAVPSGPLYDAFASAYKARYEKDPVNGYYVAQTYDAVYLAALAMELGGSAEGKAIRDAMRLVSSEGTPFAAAKFKEAVVALKSDQNIDYDGASGPVDLDGKGDVSAPYDIWQVKNGAVTVTESSITP